MEPGVKAAIRFCPVQGYQNVLDHMNSLNETQLFELCGSLYSYPFSEQEFLEDVRFLNYPEGLYGYAEGKDAFLQVRKCQGAEAILASVFVSPALRGRGMGGRLLMHCLDYLRQNGIGKVRLNVFSHNPAWRLYKSLGFSIRGSRAGYFPDGRPLKKLFMEKQIL